MTEAPDETTASIWEVKRKMAKDIEGMSSEEILEYYSNPAKAEVITRDIGKEQQRIFLQLTTVYEKRGSTPRL